MGEGTDREIAKHASLEVGSFHHERQRAGAAPEVSADTAPGLGAIEKSWDQGLGDPSVNSGIWES